MTERPSGWYDDPENPAQLRYWDGILWTPRTMPKLMPGLDHVGQARPTPSGDGAQRSLRESHQGRQGGLSGQGRAGNDPRLGGSRSGGLQVPSERQVHGQATTPVPADFLVRIVAAVIDYVLVGFLTVVILSGFFNSYTTRMNNYTTSVMNALHDGSSVPQIPSSLTGVIFTIVGIVVGALVIYEVAFTVFGGGRTLGKRALSIQTVPADGGGSSARHGVSTGSPGRVGLFRAIIRALIKWVPSALGLLGMVPQALILLVGLGNSKRQGLHDLASRTQVKTYSQSPASRPHERR